MASSVVGPEVADEADSGEEASSTRGAEVGGGRGVVSCRSCLPSLSLDLGLLGALCFCCTGSLGDSTAPGRAVSSKRLPGLDVNGEVF